MEFPDLTLTLNGKGELTARAGVCMHARFSHSLLYSAKRCVIRLSLFVRMSLF